MTSQPPKYKYAATMPDGQVITRTTHNVYSHVVVALDRRGWGWLGWASRYDLAVKLMKRHSGYSEVRILPVDNPRPQE